MSDNQLADPAIGRLHNQPPLAEVIAEELVPLRARAAQLIAVAESAIIVDDESAAKVIDLAGLLSGLQKEIDAKRDAVKRPYLDACRTIDATYGALIRSLVVCRVGEDHRGGLQAMLSAYRAKREAEAEAARQAALAEQRQREVEAEAAREAAEHNRANGQGGVGDELAALKAQEEAAAARRRAEAIRPDPVRAQLGSLGVRREIAFTVTDYRKALGWLLRVRKTETELALREVIGKHLRSMGVDAVEAGVTIPGVEATIDKQAAIRR